MLDPGVGSPILVQFDRLFLRSGLSLGLSLSALRLPPSPSRVSGFCWGVLCPPAGSLATHTHGAAHSSRCLHQLMSTKCGCDRVEGFELGLARSGCRFGLGVVTDSVWFRLSCGIYPICVSGADYTDLTRVPSCIDLPRST